MSEAIGVLFTFTTYGTHLHGAETSSVLRNRTQYGSPTLPPSVEWREQGRRLMPEPEFILRPQDRTLVVNSIMAACEHRAWHLFCVHARTNHVHAVVQPDVPADHALIYMKARATCAIRTHHPERNRFWTKHGSTRYLWDRAALTAAVDYVMNRQGSSMHSWSDQSNQSHERSDWCAE